MTEDLFHCGHKAEDGGGLRSFDRIALRIIDRVAILIHSINAHRRGDSVGTRAENAVGLDRNVARLADDGSGVQHLRHGLGKGEVRAEEDAAARRGHHHIRGHGHAHRVRGGAAARVHARVTTGFDFRITGNDGLGVRGDDVARQGDVELGEAAIVKGIHIDERIAHQARARARTNLRFAPERHFGFHIAHAEGKRDEREQIGGIEFVAGRGQRVDKAILRRDGAEDIHIRRAKLHHHEVRDADGLKERRIDIGTVLQRARAQIDKTIRRDGRVRAHGDGSRFLRLNEIEAELELFTGQFIFCNGEGRIQRLGVKRFGHKDDVFTGNRAMHLNLRGDEEYA